MFLANDILTFIGIPGDKISNISSHTENNNIFVYIDLKDERGICPYCKSSNIGIKDYYTAHINNSIIKYKMMKVQIRVRRYICRNCNKSFKQNYGLSSPGNTISYEVKTKIIEDLKSELTFKQISDTYNVSPSTVSRIFDQHVFYQKRLELTEIICVDEFCYKHGDILGKYPFVITDPLTNNIIDIVISRRKEVLIEYFNKIKITEKNNVQFFVSDMHETYRIIKKIFFKNAIHIVDKFHIVRAFNDAITSIRTRIIKNEIWDNKEYRFLKKNWKIFLAKRDKLNNIKKVDRHGVVRTLIDDLDDCLDKYPDLYYAYWTKEDFIKKINTAMYYYDAEKFVNSFETRMLSSEIKEIRKVGNTFKNWNKEIINALSRNKYNFKINNAIAEATNNKIRKLINCCYGLPNFERMRKRVLNINRNKPKEKATK